MKNKNTPDVPASVSNSFSMMLAELGDGECQNEASEKLAALVKKVSETCKIGELTVKIKLQPAGNGRIMTLTYDVVAKMPKEEKEATLLFATEDGLLQKNNPDQRELPLKALPEPDRTNAKSVSEQPAAAAKTA